MKKFNKKAFTFFAAAVTLLATMVSTSACAWFAYQPKEPKCLKDE